jgi:hypothetical protein
VRFRALKTSGNVRKCREVEEEQEEEEEEESEQDRKYNKVERKC